MYNMSKKKKRECPKRKLATLKFKVDQEDVEIPIKVSVRADGECVALPSRMEELLFPESCVEKNG